MLVLCSLTALLTALGSGIFQCADCWVMINESKCSKRCMRACCNITSTRHYFAGAGVIPTVINEGSCDTTDGKKRCSYKCVNLFSDYSLLYKQMFPRDRLVFGTDLGTGWFGKVGRLVCYYLRYIVSGSQE